GSTANGGPGAWDGPDAPHPNGGPGSWGSANGNPSGPAHWGGGGPPAQDNGGYAARGAAPDSAVAPPGRRPSPRGRGHQPGGAPTRRDAPGGAPRNADPAAGRRGSTGSWGPDSQTEPETHGRAYEAEHANRSGRPAATRKRQRSNPGRPADGIAHPDDSDAAF